MIYIKTDFPAGRWHATAWGSHVNEGVPEWPPCPWRLCRALIAAWHWKHRRQDEPVLRALIDKLASAAPDYLLPQASAAHTRHYMPVVTGKNETKTKIFDTFVHVNKGESLWIRWDVALTPAEHTLLDALLASLNYMGRAESLVIVTLLDADASPPPPLVSNGIWTTPATPAAPVTPADSSATTTRSNDFERIQLLAPQEAAAYAQASVSTRTAPDKKPARGKKKTTDLPRTLFDALQLDTADWKKEGRNLPPGSRWIEYTRPRDCLKIAPVTPPPPSTATCPPSPASPSFAKSRPPSRNRSASPNAFTRRSANIWATKTTTRPSPASTTMDVRSQTTPTSISCPKVIRTATSLT
jgi:CRISPR-associated protein Csb2